MTPRPRIYRRIERRELHSSRSGAAIAVAVVLILALAYLTGELVLAALGRSPLLIAPAGMVAGFTGLGGVAPAILGVVGGALLLAGVVLLVLAITGGRRGRHLQRVERAAVVVDDAVIASALVRAAATQDGVVPDRAVGTVSRRRAVVRITPASGLPIDRVAVARALETSLDDWGLQPALKARVALAPAGKVGA